MVVGLETTEMTETASERTVRGKEGEEGREKTPMSRTLTSRSMGRESISRHPTPYTDTKTETDSET